MFSGLLIWVMLHQPVEQPKVCDCEPLTVRVAPPEHIPNDDGSVFAMISDRGESVEPPPAPAAEEKDKKLPNPIDHPISFAWHAMWIGVGLVIVVGIVAWVRRKTKASWTK